jgi:periplasmic divalent cation tolerance protein
MTEALLILCNCADEQEASRIAHAAVEARLAACANIGAAVQSIYHWQGAIETARETPLILKTTAAHFAPLQELIASMHSYEVPEILTVPISGGSERYLAWLAASVFR